MMDKPTVTPRSFVDSTGKTVNLMRVAIALKRLQISLLLFVVSLGALILFHLSGYPLLSGSAASSAIVFALAAVVSQVRLSQAYGGRFDEALGFLLVGVLFFPILIVWFFAFY